MISGQTETTGINLINSKDLRWISTSLLHNRAHQDATAKVYVFSDSVLCLGRVGDDPDKSLNNKIRWYSEKSFFRLEFLMIELLRNARKTIKGFKI